MNDADLLDLLSIIEAIATGNHSTGLRMLDSFRSAIVQRRIEAEEAVRKLEREAT